MSYQQLNRGLTTALVAETGIDDTVLKGKEVTTRKLRKGNITAFRSVFKAKDDICKLAKLASHSEMVQEKYYDFSFKALQILEAHRMLSIARQQASSEHRMDIAGVVRSRVLRDLQDGKVTDFEDLRSEIGEVWSVATLENRADHILQAYDKVPKR